MSFIHSILKQIHEEKNQLKQTKENKQTVRITNSVKEDTDKEENNVQQIDEIIVTRRDPLDYIKELRQTLVQKIKQSWLQSNPNKKYLSVTEVVTCPMQTWLKLSGNITEDDIDSSKVFYLLEFYGRIGDTVHDLVYKYLPNLEQVEKFLYDKENKIRGKFDIIDNGNLIDIKSSFNKSDHSAQLSLYLHLAKINNIKINKVLIWYVMKDEIEEYDISYLESLIPKYLEYAKEIRRALETKRPPNVVDENHCKYCLLEKKCKRIRNEFNVTTYDSSNTVSRDNFILKFDI